MLDPALGVEATESRAHSRALGGRSCTRSSGGGGPGKGPYAVSRAVEGLQGDH